jgi:Protein of unknown function (DUF1302)
MAFAGVALAIPISAFAFEFDVGPDIVGRWDNTLQYIVGMRVQGIDPRIGNNPVFDESEYKFGHAGSVVTNRVSDLTEIDLTYRQDYGVRVTASAFKDFAYNDSVKFNPGFAAPGVPYSALSSYAGNKYSSYTRYYYDENVQLLDAFTFGTFDLSGHSTSVKLGRVAQVWGTGFFFGDKSISYSQNESDYIKGAAAPGSTVKELAIPRAQVYAQTSITPEVALAAQYFLEYEHDLLPEGGTYLGITDFLFNGPTRLLGAIPHGNDLRPSNVNDNFGVRATWTPELLSGGTLGFYYRRFDETQPWVLFGVNPATGALNYHLSYAQGTQLYGISLDKSVGSVSSGFEISYRQNTALNSATGPLPTDLSGRSGPRGNTINVIANSLVLLKKNPLYEAGTLTAEVAFTQKVGDTRNAALYNGTGNSLGCPSGNKWYGCSTNNAVGIAAQFDPQWLQVFPGTDIDMPIFMMYGVYGNPASLSVVTPQGTLAYTVGMHALIQNKYNVTLQYNGFQSHTSGLTSFGPGGPSYYAAGNGVFMYNDRAWVSLTLQTTF